MVDISPTKGYVAAHPEGGITGFITGPLTKQNLLDLLTETLLLASLYISVLPSSVIVSIVSTYISLCLECV
ncbi:hypothetical protein [Candidatus Methanomassiliicoccus intestinalis]|uniref:hypothetical protein n=1 Tax=Candidatus Methanomassiliicoccus intestinalis TaxID=1406512 RepID=UPI0037DC3126